MGFASAWLDKRTLFPRLIGTKPDKNTGIIIVVPAYNEPVITSLLNSLSRCESPECKSEVVVVVNAPPDADNEALRINEKCINDIELWKDQNSSFFNLHAVSTGKSAAREWGVGMARKAGMDEALRRFDDIGNPFGIIVSLDADCTVDENYFTSLENDFLNQNKKMACSIAFAHDLTGDNNAVNSIIQYELHLRYYIQSLNFAGFPYAFNTVGSAMAVRALQYLKCGGMNRRQAGEDFYFIQKLVEMGGYFSLNSTIVHPSSRQSDRVPFGTGATLGKLAEGNEEIFTTYNPDAFEELRTLFSSAGYLWHYSKDDLVTFFNKLPAGLRQFMKEDEFIEKISEIQRNTSDEKSFRKRFFVWFNMFRIVKYLNYVHLSLFIKQPVVVAAMKMLNLQGTNDVPQNSMDLLNYYRKLESV